jgi:hypothetical protein
VATTGSALAIVVVRSTRVEQIIVAPDDFFPARNLDLADATGDGARDLIVPLGSRGAIAVWPYDKRSKRFVATSAIPGGANGSAEQRP